MFFNMINITNNTNNSATNYKTVLGMTQISNSNFLHRFLIILWMVFSTTGCKLDDCKQNTNDLQHSYCGMNAIVQYLHKQ